MKLGDFVLLSDEADRESLLRQLREFNRTQTEYPRNRTAHGLFADRARSTPDEVAVVYGDGRLTYRELDRRSNRLARWLVDRGLKGEGVVGVMLDRGLEMPAALLAVLKAGGAYLPIDSNTPAERTAYMLREARARFLIAEPQPADQLVTLRAQCPDLTGVYLTDRPDRRREPLSGEPGFFDSGVLDSCSDAELPERSGPQSLAYLIYTSGTTGKPKGVMIEHRSIVRLVRDTNYLTLRPDDRILQTGSLAFDASTFEIWGALLNGARLCLPVTKDLLDLADLRRLLEQQEITTVFLTTSLFNMYAGLDPHVFRTLRTLLTGGEKVSVHHVNSVRKACPALTLLHVYGPTENTTFSTCFDVRQSFERDIPIGRPIANSTVQVLDENLEPVPIGAEGELYTGGDGLARGYLNDPDLTREKFVPYPGEPGQRLYRTGDRARRLPDGNIEFLGRLDNQVKVRGFRIEPAEIEYHLLQSADVRQAAVLAKDCGPDSQELVAYVAGRDGLDVGRLRARLKEQLPEYMIPSYFVPLAQLPLNASGKIDRAALPAPDGSEDRAAGRRMPETELEKQVAGIWQEVLQRQDIAADDDFFDLGGHSLKATKLASLVQKRMGVSLALTAVFRYPTVAQLADAILTAARFGLDVADQPLVLLAPATGGPSLFAFPPGSGDAVSYAQLARCLPRHDLHCFNFIEADSRIGDYADLIAATAPEPYRLVGYSGGGNLAYHVAGELESRGRRVAQIVMFDSSRHLEKVPGSAAAARQLATLFMDDESIRPYINSVVLREKVIRLVQRYYAFISESVDHLVVDAEIHVIASQGAVGEYRDEAGRLLLSTDLWSQVTRGEFQIHTGSGDHNHMLYAPHAEPNARLLEQIVARTT